MYSSLYLAMVEFGMMSALRRGENHPFGYSNNTSEHLVCQMRDEFFRSCFGSPKRKAVSGLKWWKIQPACRDFLPAEACWPFLNPPQP
jgi:hypothetical protein